MPTDFISHTLVNKTIRLQPNRVSFDVGGSYITPKYLTYHEALADPYSSYGSPFSITLDENNARNDDYQKKIFLRQPGLYRITASMCKSGTYTAGVSNSVRILLYQNNGILNRELAHAGEEYLVSNNTIMAFTTVRLVPSDFEGGNPWIEIVIRGNGTLLGWNTAASGGADYDELGRTGTFVELTLDGA